MSAPQFYRQILDLSLRDVKQYRKHPITEAVFALTRGATANLSGIGRKLKGKAKVKHKIKKMDRLLGNKHLFEELPCIYGRIIELFTRNLKECVIAIDWSAYPTKKYYQLRASLVYQGRAIPMFSVMTEEKYLSAPNIQKMFLNQLSQFIGKNKQVTVITDAGFRISWFKAVSELGWYYVGRIRNNVKFQLEGEQQWNSLTDIRATLKKPMCLGNITLSKSSLYSTTLYVYQKKLFKESTSSKRVRAVVKKHMESDNEPWIIVSNLPKPNAQKVVNIYRCRMQIEQNFRDEKSAFYGLGASHCRSQGIVRLSILCLLGVLACTVLWLHGFYLEFIKKQHRSYQANTTTKRTLSFIFLARNALFQHPQHSPPLSCLSKIFLIFSNTYETIVFSGGR